MLTLPAPFVDELVGRFPENAPPAEVVRPVHVVYGGAHLFTAGTVEKLGARARAAMESFGADSAAFGRTVGVEGPLAEAVAARVREKLARRPVEALCIDFEDGYGPRTDDEEDAEAIRAASELAKTVAPATSIGIRIKALGGKTARRGLRTLDLFLTALATTSGDLSEGFTVTLPKVASTNEVAVLADVLAHLESSLGLSRQIGIELMIETPHALLDAEGRVPIRALVDAARGRTACVHLGAYDLTSELEVSAGDQRLDHPYCDLARMLLRVSLAGTSIGLSDGTTTVLPIAPKGASAEASLTAVHRAWTLHATNVRRAIDVGIWQGWDVHPAQLPARYGALFTHFLTRRAEVAARLRSFVDHAAQASRLGQLFDDAATGRALESFFRRGVACGAFDEDVASLR